MSSTSSDSRIAASSSMTRILAPVELPLTAGDEAGRVKVCSTSGMDRIPQKRKLEMKRCAGVDSTLDMNLSSMFLDDAVRDGQAKPGAAAVTRLWRGFGGEKGIVDALEVLGCDAGARVVYHCGDAVFLPIGERGHAQAASALHGFFCVQQQVEKYLLQLAGIAVDRRQFMGQIKIDDDLSGLELVFEQRERIADHLVQIGIAEL